MGCLRLPYQQENECLNFLGVWKKTARPGNCIDYYPFGLQTQNSWTRESATGNNFLYNACSELPHPQSHSQMMLRFEAGNFVT